MIKRMIFICAAIAIAAISARDNAFAASAEENYKWYCAQCHGNGGKGDGINVTKDMAVTPRNHTDAVEMSKLTDTDVINAITDGGPANSKSPLMPPFGKTMSADEIKDLTAYIRKLCNCKSSK